MDFTIEQIMICALLVIIASLLVISIVLRYDCIRRKQKTSPIQIGCAQYIGTREKQDDSFATSKMPYGLMAIVADGIGGFLNGNVASKITVDSFVKNFNAQDVSGNISYFFNHAAKEANYQIRKQFEDSPCGTTTVSIVIMGNQMQWLSVGDSIISLYRNGRLIPINRKQNYENWLEQQYYDGKIQREMVIDHPQSRRLINYIGYDGFEGGEESKRPLVLKKGDKVLLYSDGVETLNQIELEAILARKDSAMGYANMIMEAIRQKNVKSKDNATVIVADIKENIA